MATTNTNAPICRFHQRGSCKFGSRCRNQHLNIVSEINTNQPQSASKNRVRTRTRRKGGRSGTAALHRVTDNLVCFSWQKGSCPRGDTCKFPHPPKCQDAENQELKDSSSSSNVLQTGGEGYQSVPDGSGRRCLGDLLAKARAEDKEKNERLRQEDPEVQRKRDKQHKLEETLIYREVPQIDGKQLTSDDRWPRFVVFDSDSEAGPSRLPQEEDVELAEARAKQVREENEQNERLYQEEIRRTRDERHRQEETHIRQEEQQHRIDEGQRGADALRTHQCTVFGSIITFSSGLAIQNIIAGFDCCRIRVKNIPHDARPHEIEALFLQQGLDVSDFHVIAVDSTSNGTMRADIVTNATVAQILAVGLEGIEFRDERLEFEVGTYNLPGGMGALAPEDENVLTISCRGPSATYSVVYPDMATCHFRVVELNGRICSGRKVKAEIQTLAGRIVPTFQRNAIQISNLPNDVSLATVCDFAKSDFLHAQLLASSNFDIDAACRQLRLQINKVAGGEVQSFDLTSRGNAEDGIFSVRVRFKTWECAKKVENALANRCYSFVGNSMFWLKLPQQQLYTIVIPSPQYRAQASLWTDLETSIKDPKACDLFIREEPGGDFRIQISGAVKAAIGALKVRIENLASGEKFDQWHELLALPSATLTRKIKNAGAFMRSDLRTHSIKLYGTSIAIRRAKTILKEEIDRLMSMQSSVQLERRSVGYFLRTGLTAMKEVFGEDSVTLDIRSARITIRGGEEISLHLKNHIAESLKAVIVSIAPGNHICPVCYDEASAPFQLVCRHVYCTACIRHFLTSAAETGIFPLACMGNDATCGTLISIPVIQKFLPQNSFNRLLETVFTSYVDKQPQVFGHCKTPDCTQIYRKSESPSPLLCPSCFSEICSSCGEDSHVGMVCEEARIFNSTAEQERLSEAWIMQQSGIKKCPTEGCNHMECPCGSHICWRCMGVFPRHDIYRHMHAEHGGYYAADPTPDVNLNNNAPDPFQGADYLEQARFLRELEVRRRHGRELLVQPLVQPQERGSYCVVM
ncbi:hypothetical protein IW261DRAFT_1478323 [Armillaria novae-zelandiae]|uniref:RBR-type E3 ubiquitin transferase n=1 Tax=Armillaria novae-zelandiae TaxID=153914 RepID=A0AA39P8W3_9AGAR|nr:hypothetical protein IW261DRAFT_1478323 [Armillaria novae-zelandiae]